MYQKANMSQMVRHASIWLRTGVICLTLLLFFSPQSKAEPVRAPSDGQQVIRQELPRAGGEEQRLRRIPPPAARNACIGKKEGDPCTFLSPHGQLEGECLSGSENQFACRPHRRSEATDTVPSASADKPPKSDAGTSGQTKTVTEIASKPASGTNNLSIEPPPPVQTPPATPDQTGKQDQLPKEIPVKSDTGFQGSSLMCSPLFLFLVAVGAAGLTWFIFFRRSTLPLRRLRKVTQQLAQGNLSARVGEGLEQRRDEIAELARDVDRMAERIESLVNAHQRLVRDVSHELRSPLARLNVALELARQTAGPDLTAPFDRIDRESERLNELIAQLLMLTKLENNSTALQYEQLDLTALIAEIVHDVDFEARSKERRVITTAAEPFMIEGNRELLRQALENLIRNAARYTAQDTAVDVTIRCRSVGGRNWAHVEVRDYGPGVPESELYDIFRPFYRVNDARERQSGGSGVGLAIADRAVRLHGGSLRAFNAPSGGLVMELELPF